MVVPPFTLSERSSNPTMYRADIMPNPNFPCTDEKCPSPNDRVANVRLFENKAAVINTPLCFTHRQLFLQAITTAIRLYDKAAGQRGLTPFQESLIIRLENDPRFLHWCISPHQLHHDPAPRTPTDAGCLFTYYTRDGVLHADRVGATEVLHKSTFPASARQEGP